MNEQWNNGLPRPIAFAFSGGASLGSVQVGMLRALHKAGIRPDLIVGASVGALNGAVIAAHGFERGIELLETLWTELRRTDIFADGCLSKLLCLLQTGQSLFRHDRLANLIQEILRVHSFEELRLPLGVVTTELMSRHSALFTSGELQPALLASSAIPGLLPSVKIEGRRHVDGCLSANVPLKAAVQMGAASLVVLDAGNRRQSSQPPRCLADQLLGKVFTALRQQVLVDAPLVAQQLPVVYLPAPALPHHSLFDFAGGTELIEQTAAHVTHFLATAAVPTPGNMCGSLQFQATQHAEIPMVHERHFEQVHPVLAVA